MVGVWRDDADPLPPPFLPGAAVKLPCFTLPYAHTAHHHPSQSTTTQHCSAPLSLSAKCKEKKSKWREREKKEKTIDREREKEIERETKSKGKMKGKRRGTERNRILLNHFKSKSVSECHLEPDEIYMIPSWWYWSIYIFNRRGSRSILYSVC